MDEYTLILLLVALCVVGPAIVFFAGERVNRTLDEDAKGRKGQTDERR
jgi:hypothetical protein